MLTNIYNAMCQAVKDNDEKAALRICRSIVIAVETSQNPQVRQHVAVQSAKEAAFNLIDWIADRLKKT